MKGQANPFVISGYEGAKYFCDRVDETAQMASEIANGNNIALIATRRMGKSGLIEHYFTQQEVQAQYYTFFVDIYDTQSLSELILRLSREILMRLKPFGRRALDSFWQTVHSLQTGISFNPMGEPSFNLQIGQINEPSVSLDEIFRYLEIADKPCIVAIDEFQQINKYPEKNIEATLRTYVQHCHNVQFIFSGSQRHTMSAMFTNASRPFFQSVSIMHLEAIDINAYDFFAKALFAEGNRSLADGVTKAVYEVSHGITWYTQKLFNTLYAHTAEGTTCVPDDVADALEYIIKTQSYSYEEVLFRLPERQKQVLIALAKSGPTKSITSASFLQANALPSASMVQSAVRGLLEKDYITLFHGVYSVYDLFLDYWIQREL